MDIPRRSPGDTTVVLIDYAVGFGNLFRSHRLSDNIMAATALAEAALAFNTGLVVTHGLDSDPPGPIYPTVRQVLGDGTIVRRRGEFDAFEHPDFASAVERTGRPHLAVGGLMTEGCVLFTVLGALRRGYSVSLVVDACAGESAETHQLAVQRMIQLGVTPTSWLSLATEFQGSWDNAATVGAYANLIMKHSPQLGLPLAGGAPEAA